MDWREDLTGRREVKDVDPESLAWIGKSGKFIDG